MVLLSAHHVQNELITSTIMGEQNPEKMTKLVIQKENCRESHSSNTFEDLNLIVFVDMQDMQFLGMLLYCTQFEIYLVSEVDIGSMVDQFPDNPHISHLGCHHEGRLLRLLRSNRQIIVLDATSMYTDTKDDILMSSYPLDW